MIYGRCPTCGGPGQSRERRPNGDTICVNGHKHSSLAFQRHLESSLKVRREIKANLEAAQRQAAIFRTEEVRVSAADVRWILDTLFKDY